MTTAVKREVFHPLIYGYQFYAYPLAVIGMRPNVLPWLYSNFITVGFRKDFVERPPVPFGPFIHDYASNPFLETQRFRRDFLKMIDQPVIPFVTRALDEGYCVYLNLDEFYVPHRRAYQQWNYSHDTLVIGYDPAEHTLTLIGFDENQTFKETMLTYGEFQAAYDSLDVISNQLHQIYLYRYNPDGQYTLNQRLIADLLEEYLLGINTSERYYMSSEPYDRAWGTDVYECLAQYLALLQEDKIKLDLRFLHTFWEHKMMMARRAEYFEQQGYLSSDLQLAAGFSELEKRAVTYRNRLLKYRFDHKSHHVQSILDELDAFRNREAELLTQMIHELRQAESVR